MRLIGLRRRIARAILEVLAPCENGNCPNPGGEGKLLVPPGIRNLSELTIDVHKDWGGFRIENLGAPTAVGHAVRNVLTTHGDIFFRNATDIARLAAGTSGQYLQTKGPAADPAWATVVKGIANVKIGYFNRFDAGFQAITVGFKPKNVIFFAHAVGGVNSILSMGFDDGTDHYCTYLSGDSVDASRLNFDSIFVRIDADNAIEALIDSMDDDGFTLKWTLLGTVTAHVIYLAMK